MNAVADVFYRELFHSENLPSYDLFGAKITPATGEELLSILDSHIGSERQAVIASQNMHGLHMRLQDADFDALHRLQQTYVHIDGMPLVWLCKMRGIRASAEHRVTLVDWIWPLLERASERGWRVYYLGGSETVLQRGAAAIRKRFPDLQLRTHHGFFDATREESNRLVIDDITAFAPQLILVGMGMGRQERWILENLERVAPASICTVGACMEYVAGVVKTPPRWMGAAGLEWLFRLSENPGRFWQRYLIEPWAVVLHLLRYRA